MPSFPSARPYPEKLTCRRNQFKRYMIFNRRIWRSGWLSEQH
jgi:hypothetical protein